MVRILSFRTLSVFTTSRRLFSQSSPILQDKKTEASVSDTSRVKTDPRETCIVLFPGQGAQFVGMGRQLVSEPAIKSLYERASAILGYNLLDVCLKGPKVELDRTVHCQPAIVVTSLAAVENLRKTKPAIVSQCVGSAGFSVGELSSLIFSGMLSFEDGIRLVKIRGEAMQEASDRTPSGMTTVYLGADSKLSLACTAAKEWCRTRLNVDVELQIANYLYPECKVIAGHVQALEFIEKSHRDFHIRRVKRLPVSGAFHTSLMSSAKEKLVAALSSVSFSGGHCAVYSNLDVHQYSPKNAARLLSEQMCNPVSWEQTMHRLFDRPSGRGFPRAYECGPGKQLTAILKQLNARVPCEPVKV